MKTIKVFSAGVAGMLAKDTAKRVMDKYPELTVDVEMGGSVAGVNQFLAGEPYDVLILADCTALDTQLMPGYTDGYYIFAGNELVVTGPDVSSENWKEKLLAPNSEVRHFDPYRDPSGYRAVMAMQLADNVEPGLSEKLLNHPNYTGLDKDQYNGFPGPKPGPGPDNGHDIYRFIYKSGAVSRGMPFAELPPEMNQGDPAYDDLYASVSFETEGGNVVKGSRIMHAIFIPKRTENPESAEAFVQEFISQRFFRMGFTGDHKAVGNWTIKPFNMWDAEARYYSLMTLMEVNGTNLQLDAMPLDKDDVVLDCGCGPGRVAIQLAKRVKKVIALDNSEGMMAECKKNCAAAGVENVEFVLADWQETEIGKTIPEVDVVIQSRGGGGPSTKSMLQKAARKYAVTVMWSDGAPCLPESRNKLFVDCYSDDVLEQHPELKPFGRPDGKRRPMSPMDKDKLPMAGKPLTEYLQREGIEHGFTTVEEGWDRQFATKEEAYDWLLQLSRHPELVNMDQFKKNVDSFLTEKDGGWYFFLPTSSDVTWWKTR